MFINLYLLPEMCGFGAKFRLKSKSKNSISNLYTRCTAGTFVIYSDFATCCQLYFFLTELIPVKLVKEKILEIFRELNSNNTVW